MLRRPVAQWSLAAILVALVAAPGPAAERVTFRLKSGETITGELLEPTAHGDYRLEVGERIVEIPHDDVFTTIEVDESTPAGVETPRPEETWTTSIATSEVLSALQQRLDSSAIAAENLAVFRSCMAEATRGDWDFAIRTAEKLLDLEPTWPAPQILRAQLLSERGQNQPAVALGLWLESMANDDALALEVAATCYRRAGFARRAIEVTEKALARKYSTDRAEYETVALWWGVDAVRADRAWQRVIARDPLLRSPWCREGRLLHRAEMALAASDWEAAQVAIEELKTRLPWARAEARPVEIRILERRLRECETSGRTEEALVALAALLELDPGRDSEWKARRVALEEHHLRRGLSRDDFDSLRRWASTSAGILRVEGESRDRVAERFQEIGCKLAARSELDRAALAFDEAKRWSPTARSAHLSESLGPVFDRAREDVAMHRTLRVLRLAEILRDAFPEQRDGLLDRFTSICRDEMQARGHGTEEISQRIAELNGLFLRRKSPDQLTGDTEVATREPSEEKNGSEALTAIAYPSLARYFPHGVGARWVYELSEGRREEWEVVSLTPLDGGGWKIEIRVRGEGEPRGFTRYAYLQGGDLLNGFATAPPGEVALRYPLSDGERWQWEKESIAFVRELRRPKDPLTLPAGTLHDYLVVEASNTIRVGGDREITTRHSVVYAANIGIVKIESDDPGLARTLLQFTPSPEDVQTAARD
ncbi:MAG: hypothetical protein KDC38_11810 [Planctomycetes bacterium]|nr:hypothetical protein [Planctomycetota bacterium]